MKKLVTILVVAVAFSISFGSCELDDCKNCRQVIYNEDDGSVYEDNDTPEEFCGEDLSSKENADPVTAAGLTNSWVCE